jgi:hypothetical protein
MTKWKVVAKRVNVFQIPTTNIVKQTLTTLQTIKCPKILFILGMICLYCRKIPV